MIRRRSATEPERWFLEDRAIESSSQDHLNHEAVAAVLVEAVGSANPPCMIGLLGEFGRGKSSTANMAVDALNSGAAFDAVRVTADKHTGNARARNLVHAIAGELGQLKGLDGAEIRELLRPLRQSTEVAAPDPTTTALTRLLSGQYKWPNLAVSLLPFAVVAIVLGFGTVLAGGALKSVLGVLAASPLLIWIAALTFAPGNTPIGALITPGTHTDQTPRAEAADEIEEIFGLLVDYHGDHRKRRLVVFVDDIDRLSKDDLLDALRALRSLQSVPRGREPVFVIACNERIVESAVSSSSDHPAELPVDPESETEQGDAAPEVQAREPLAPTGAATDHSHPALAFIDKLLTVRVQMPPTLRGDMRRFAHEAIAEDHPLRSQPDLDLDRVLAILIHDGVQDPRSVIRLINRFVATFLLGRNRETSGWIYKGDVTMHLGVIAQLAVIVDEFDAFYTDITRNTAVLEAASKASLGRSDLTASEVDALAHSHQFEPDASQPSGFRFRHEALRRYLAGTARLVRYPVDVSPLVYLTATPGGRSLGVELRNRIVSALRVGDADELVGVLEEVPADRKNDAAQELADLLREGSAIDAPNYLAAVAPNLDRVQDAEAVADAAVELIEKTDYLFPVELLTAVLDHANPGRDSLLCERLTTRLEDLPAANSRYQAACRYLIDHPRIRQHVEPFLLGWLDGLPDQGGWVLARPWLDVADNMSNDNHAELLTAAISATTHMVRDESSFTTEDATHLVQLASRKPEAVGRLEADQLTAAGPHTLTAFVGIWDVTNYRGEAADAYLASTAAADGKIATSPRGSAIALISNWADAWKDGTHLNDEEEDVPIAPDILANLTEAAADPALAASVGSSLRVYTETCGALATGLADAVLTQVERVRDEGQIDEAESLARDLIAASASLPSDFLDATSTRLLSPIAPDSDPVTGTVEMALRLLAYLSPIPGGDGALSKVADTWANRIRSAGAHDDRCLLRGFQSLAVVSADVVNQKSAPIFAQIEQLLASNDDAPGRLRTLSSYPWPDANVVGALSHLQTHWEEIPDDARLGALHLSSRAPDGSPPLSFFNQRISELTSERPEGPYTAIAAANLPRMTVDQRALVFVAVGDRNASITSAWVSTDEEEASDVIARHASDDEARHLLGRLPTDRVSQVAVASLTKMTSLDDVTEELIDAVASFAEEAQLRQVGDAALGIATEPANSAAAMRVAVGAARHGVMLDTKKVDDLIIDLLPDASDDVARLIGRATGKRTPSGPAADTLKQLRKSGSSAVNAFDAARE